MGVGRWVWVVEQRWVVVRLAGRVVRVGFGYRHGVGQERWSWGGWVHSWVGQLVEQVG